MNNKGMTILFVVIFAITAIIIGYSFYPSEKEPTTLNFEKNWMVGSYEVGCENSLPLLEFNYNGFNYTTNPVNQKTDSLPKIPLRCSLETITTLAANKEVESFQNLFARQNRVYALYAIVTNGEVYYSTQRIYEGQDQYNVNFDILDHDMIKISHHPDWISFWFVSIIGSLMISAVCTLFIAAYYKEKKQKGQ